VELRRLLPATSGLRDDREIAQYPGDTVPVLQILKERQALCAESLALFQFR
jgi:hypothetical protein